MSNAHAEQPPISVYLKVWALLFILAGVSYAIAVMGLPDGIRHILLFSLALIQAGLIVAVLMHLVWERLIVVYLIVIPPVLLIAFLAISAVDGSYTHDTRVKNYLPPDPPAAVQKAE